MIQLSMSRDVNDSLITRSSTALCVRTFKGVGIFFAGRFFVLVIFSALFSSVK